MMEAPDWYQQIRDGDMTIEEFRLIIGFNITKSGEFYIVPGLSLARILILEFIMKRINNKNNIII